MRLKTLIILFMTLLYCSNIQANAPKGLGVFVKHELNDTDTITSVGVIQRINFGYSDAGAEASTNVSYVDILTDQGFMEDYFAWEVGVKLGYFSQVFFYVEAGLDIAELLFNDSRSAHFSYSDYGRNNTQDGYAGVGMGLQLNNIRLEFSTRARKINSHAWESERQIFYGLQLTVLL